MIFIVNYWCGMILNGVTVLTCTDRVSKIWRLRNARKVAYSPPSSLWYKTDSWQQLFLDNFSGKVYTAVNLACPNFTPPSQARVTPLAKNKPRRNNYTWSKFRVCRFYFLQNVIGCTLLAGLKEVMGSLPSVCMQLFLVQP